MAERLRECGELQEPITQAARDALVGRTIEVLVDAVDPETAAWSGARTARRPEIDGVVRITGDAFARPGALVSRGGHGCDGPDLDARDRVRRDPRGVVTRRWRR